ncbi:ligase I, DNA, ATP-dependent, isoform CRA_b, partial [Rattus norvegicus]
MRSWGWDASFYSINDYHLTT